MTEDEDLKAIDELATVFTEEQSAQDLLDRIDFPIARRPVFAPDPRSVWRRVYRDVQSGRTTGGTDALLRAALHLYPENATFRRLAGKPETKNDEPRDPEWLDARNEVRRLLERGRSVNLVVDSGADWRQLLDDLRQGDLADLATVNLEKPATTSRRGLVIEILRVFGMTAPVPPEPEDLNELDRFLSARDRNRLALTHFDLAAHRSSYGVDLFAALRYLVMESRKLVLLVQSRRPFATLLPADHPLSEIDLQMVELRGHR